MFSVLVYIDAFEGVVFSVSKALPSVKRLATAGRWLTYVSHRPISLNLVLIPIVGAIPVENLALAGVRVAELLLCVDVLLE